VIMVAISISEIQPDFPASLRRVQAGEVILITDQDQPIAEIKTVPAARNAQRPFGPCAGEFHVPDDFDDGLPDDILRAFSSR